MDKTECSIEGCEESYPNNKWGKIKAAGWFFSRETGDSYCPAHVPEWVASWREANKAALDARLYKKKDI